MKKELIVDERDTVTKLSGELSPSRDELIRMPEPAGEPAVDYPAILEKWKEERGRLLRPVPVPRREDD